MRKLFAVTAVLALLGMGGAVAQAAITIETVPVGNAGNASLLGYGSVSYNYNIGKYEVTAGQYTAFLNAVAATDPYSLYSTYMANPAYPTEGCNIQRTGSPGSYVYSVALDWANRPVNYVSFWDACRFANWLCNGQGSGDTETGAYTLTPTGMADNTITRNPGATWAVTSENEWFKAAYHKNDGVTGNYWLYPTGSNTAPGQNMADPGGNNANIYTSPWVFPLDSGKYTTIVGEFQNSPSAYGTYDQGGNVWEWNETRKGYQNDSRCKRGGSFNSTGADNLKNSYQLYNVPGYEYMEIGFRVVGLPPPAPTVTGINPNSGSDAGDTIIHAPATAGLGTEVAGTGFQAGAAVKLAKSGQSDILATSVSVVSSTDITCSLDLAGAAVGQWDVVVTNPDTQSGMLANGFTITDGIAPVIGSVALGPTMFYPAQPVRVFPGEPIRVEVDVTDNAAVTSVTANGTALAFVSGSSWGGYIGADSALGLHTMTIVAGDTAGNSVTDTSQSYKTAQLVGTVNRSLVGLTAAMADTFLFKTWGRVTRLDDDSFELNDSPGTPIKVFAAGHGLITGDYASVWGIWSVIEGTRVLNSTSANVKKI